MKELKSSMDFQNFISAYEDGELQITSKVSYKIRDVIEQNERLFHGKFENPKDGTFTKIFYNIGFILFRTIYQNTDLDLKDMLFRSLNGRGIQALALLKMAVYTYLKRIKFSSFLNDLRYFIKDGTTIVKIVDGEPTIVSNHNIVRPPYGGTIQETGIGEKCLYSWSDMLSHKNDWQEAWNQIEELKTLMDKKSVKDFVVWEYWNEIEIDGETHKGCIKYLDNRPAEPSDRLTNSQPKEWDPYVELERFKTPHKKKRTSKRLAAKLGAYEELYPYKELHFIKIPGRTLGFSVFELVAGIQEAYNRKMNLHDKKDILDLMGVFVHKKENTSPSIAQSLLNNIEQGTVVEMEITEDLQRLVIDTKTAELIANIDKLKELAFQITGVTMQGAGEAMPASITATNSVINQQVQKTTYDYAIEQMSLFLTELFDDFYLEVILDEIDAEEMNSVVGDPEELKALDEFYIDQYVGGRTEQRYNAEEQRTGDVSWEQVDVMDQLAEAEKGQLKEELAKLGDTRWTNIKKEFINQINYAFEFYVNNEGFDKNTKIANLMAMRQNTELSTKKIDATILDIMNENPKQYEKTEQEKQQEMAALQQKTMIENSHNMPAMPNMPMTPGKEFAVNNQL